jgi:phage tail sheath gpL-like
MESPLGRLLWAAAVLAAAAPAFGPDPLRPGPPLAVRRPHAPAGIEVKLH